MNSAGNASTDVSRTSGLASSTAPTIDSSEQKGGYRLSVCQGVREISHMYILLSKEDIARE